MHPAVTYQRCSTPYRKIAWTEFMARHQLSLLMDGDRPKPNNPLSPFYPSEMPNLGGNGRRWFAILMVAVLVIGTGYWIFPI